MNASVYTPSSMLTGQPVAPILKCDPDSDETPYCALCLRERPPGAEFYEYSAGNASPEFRATIQSIVGLELNMENDFNICTPCWKMIQLMVDFRLCCFKAQDWLGRYGCRGIKCSDEWFNGGVGQAIDGLRSTIQEHVAQFEGDEAYSEDQDHVETISDEEEEMLTYEQVDRIDETEGLVTQISVGDFKIEVFDDVDLDTAQSTGNIIEQIRCEKCKRCFESKQALDVHIQLCGTQSKTINGQSTAGEVQICTLCNAMLANLRTLRSHISSVHGPKKHHCEYCPSKFARAYDLKKHCWALHPVEKPISLPANQASPASGSPYSQVIDKAGPTKALHRCPTCEKRFTKYSTLEQHMQRWHAHLMQA